MRIITDVECPKCKSHYIKDLDKYRYFNRMPLGIGMIAFGCYMIKAMIDEHDIDPAIAMGFLSSFGSILGGLIVSIYALVKQLSKRKAIYRCQLCKSKF